MYTFKHRICTFAMLKKSMHSKTPSRSLNFLWLPIVQKNKKSFKKIEVTLQKNQTAENYTRLQSEIKKESLISNSKDNRLHSRKAQKFASRCPRQPIYERKKWVKRKGFQSPSGTECNRNSVWKGSRHEHWELSWLETLLTRKQRFNHI